MNEEQGADNRRMVTALQWIVGCDPALILSQWTFVATVGMGAYLACRLRALVDAPPGKKGWY